MTRFQVWVIGGIQNRIDYQNATYYLDVQGGSNWTQGPPLITGRNAHKAWVLKRSPVSNTNCIIVAGGVISNTSALNSTEVLNDEVGATWQSGPPLPEPITAATMVGYPYGEGVLMMGGFALDPNSVTMTKIYYLRDCSSQWEVYNKTLSQGRIGHIAQIMPCSTFKC